MNALPKAIFSEDRKYRYLLTRTWDGPKGYVAFIGLNPSTADEELDDPTIRRCINYAKSWGYGGLIMGNLFAYRATDPKVMKLQKDPVGALNDEIIKSVFEHTDLVICAWGTHGKYLDRGETVKNMLKPKESKYYGDLCYLGLTKDGYPKHPLYLKKDLVPICWY